MWKSLGMDRDGIEDDETVSSLHERDFDKKMSCQL